MSFLRIFAAAVCALALSACMDKSAPPKKHSALPVKTMTLAFADEPTWLETIGTVEELQSIAVKPRATGILLSKSFTEGELVHEGDVLFRLDRAALQAALESASAAVRQERSLVAQYERERNRTARLYKSDAATRQELDNANSALEQRKAALAAAIAKERDAQISLGYTDVKSPATGYISRALVDEGTLVSANTTELATISAQGKIRIRWGLSETDLVGKTITRQTPILVYPIGAKEPIPATLDYISRTIGTQYGTKTFRAVLPADHALVPGQLVRVRTQSGILKDACRIPIASVRQLPDGTYSVYALRDGKAVEIPVQVAHWVGADWVLTGGLAKDDRVITNQLIRLKNGIAVTEATPSKGS